MNLLTEKISKLYIKYILPSVVGSLAYGVLIFIDTVFIGQGIGVDGIAALNIAIPVFSLTAFGMLLGIGGATASSIDLGRKDFNKRDAVFTLSVTIGVILSVVFSVFLYIYLDEITMLLGARENIFSLSREYIAVISFSIIFYIIPHILNNFIKNDNNPRLPMIFFLIVSVANIVLDYVFIFVFKWGMFGAAFATSIAQGLGTLTLLTHFKKPTSTLKFRLETLNFNLLPRIVSIGLSCFMTEIALGSVLVITNHQIYKYLGNNGVSAYGIIYNINLLLYLVFSGIALGAQPLISTNFGANQFKRIRETLILGLKSVIILSVLFFIVMIKFTKPLIHLFNRDNLEVINITAQGFPMFFMALFFLGINLKMNYFFQAIESPKLANILTFLRSVVFIIFFLMIIPAILGAKFIWLSFLFSEILTFFVGLYFYKKIYKTKILKK
ncbi:MAG: MATE family efflux transporter [Fusobacteriaceae bacterium]